MGFAGARPAGAGAGAGREPRRHAASLIGEIEGACDSRALGRVTVLLNADASHATVKVLLDDPRVASLILRSPATASRGHARLGDFDPVRGRWRLPRSLAPVIVPASLSGRRSRWR